jgi:hypothetical protein
MTLIAGETWIKAALRLLGRKEAGKKKIWKSMASWKETVGFAAERPHVRKESAGVS